MTSDGVCRYVRRIVSSFTSRVSVSEHMHSVIRSCSQTDTKRAWHEYLRATRRLQSYCYSEIMLRLQRLVGLHLGTHRQHLDGFIRHSIHQGYYASDLDITGIIDQADKKLFQLVLTNPNHVLSSLLPDKTHQRYYLRPRRHNRPLVDNSNRLFSNYFIKIVWKLLLISD